MKKGLLKATAVLATVVTVATSFPINNVKAAPNYVFPAAGVALAAGNGCSIADIRANVARNAAKQSTIANHEKITKKDESTVKKVETPSSKAVSEGTVIDGIAVVGDVNRVARVR